MKFLVADDHELFLQGLEFILRKEFPKAELVLAKSYTEIFKILEKQNDFDLIITDLAMPGANWYEALSRIHNTYPDIGIVVISAVFDHDFLQKTYDIGVSGYVSKSFSNSLIISAINLVLAGGMYIPPELLQVSLQNSPQPIQELIRDLNEPEKNVKEDEELTPRQMEVLQCLGEGLSNKVIAYKLGVSEGTVKIHITLLMRKLGVKNRVAAVLEAEKRGLFNKGEADERNK